MADKSPDPIDKPPPDIKPPEQKPPDAKPPEQKPAAKPEEKKVARLGLFKPVPQENLLARTLFSGNPDYALPQVSHDGKWLAHLQAVDGVMNVWLGSFDEPEKSKPLTDVKDRPLRNFFWAYDNKTILYSKDSGGNENFHIYAVDINATALEETLGELAAAEQVTHERVLCLARDVWTDVRIPVRAHGHKAK